MTNEQRATEIEQLTARVQRLERHLDELAPLKPLLRFLDEARDPSPEDQMAEEFRDAQNNGLLDPKYVRPNR